MNIKNGILNVPKHGNKHDLIHFVIHTKTNLLAIKKNIFFFYFQC